jgi:small-conductance mechanosensitive channel
MGLLTENASPLIAGVLIGLCFLNWRVVRSRPIWARIGSSSVLFALLTAAVTYTAGSPLEPKFVEEIAADRLSQQIIVSLWWLLGARLIVEVMRGTTLIKQFAGQGQLFSDLIGALVYLTVVLTIVKTVFGFPIGGLVATSGIIAIVLGLALQNTLADVFAGIAVGIESPYAIGDLVWIEGPIEGEIVQINWRSVQIRTFGNDIATVPNSVVAKSRIVNRSVPTTRRSDTVHLPCDVAVPPERVFELIQWAILLCPNVLEKPAPATALVRIGKRTNGYDVSFSVAHSNVLWQTKSTLLKEVLRQFRSAGIKAGVSFPSGLAGAPASTRNILDIPLFEVLSPESRSQLEAQLIQKSLQPGDILFSEGDSEASLYITCSGVLEVSRTIDGSLRRIGRIGAGDYIGEIGMLTGEAHAATVKALTHCTIYELHKNHIAPLLKAEPELVRAFELSAKRGQALIDRSVAASVGAETVPSGQLLNRMRAFFHLHGH